MDTINGFGPGNAAREELGENFYTELYERIGDVPVGA